MDSMWLENGIDNHTDKIRGYSGNITSHRIAWFFLELVEILMFVVVVWGLLQLKFVARVFFVGFVVCVCSPINSNWLWRPNLYNNDNKWIHDIDHLIQSTTASAGAAWRLWDRWGNQPAWPTLKQPEINILRSAVVWVGGPRPKRSNFGTRAPASPCLGEPEV